MKVDNLFTAFEHFAARLGRSEREPRRQIDAVARDRCRAKFAAKLRRRRAKWLASGGRP